jgi:hypothetical protein
MRLTTSRLREQEVVMKTPLTLAALAMCIALSTTASAQTPGPGPEARNAFFVNPVLAPFGIYSVGYERILGDRIGLDLNASYANIYDRTNDDRVTGGMIGLAPHFFLTKGAPRGLYIAPGVDLQRVEVTGDFTGSGTSVDVSTIAGYSWAGRVLCFRMGLGGKYYVSDVRVSDPNGNAQTVDSGLRLTGELKLGARF